MLANDIFYKQTAPPIDNDFQVNEP